MNVEEFRKYLEIDKNNLDEEIIRHPSLLFEVGEAYAEAAAERDAAKEVLATVEATIDAEIRENSDGGKITEALVKNKIQADTRRKDAFFLFLEAKLRADVLSSLKDSFHQRGYLIRDLAALFTANYFESTAVKETSATDAVIYRKRQQQLADARERRRQENDG